MLPSERRELLTALARVTPPEADDLRGMLARVDDWPLLFAHINAHGVQGLALDRLRDPEWADVVPPSVLDDLRESVRATSARNLTHTRDLVRVAKALPDGVELLLSKGVHLAEYVYDRPSARTMTDIDLFIREADVDAVERAMLDLGFTLEERRKRPREWWIENFQHLEPLVSPAGVRFEMHLRNASRDMPYKTEMEPIWDRSECRDYAGASVRVMTAEDHLVFLILHLYVHEIHLVKLLGLCDLDRTIRSVPELNWEAVIDHAKRQRVEPLLHLPLRLAADLLGAPVPPEVLAGCRPADLDDDDLRFLADYVFRDDLGREMVPARVSQALAADGGRARLVRRMLLPTDGELRERYNLPERSARVIVYRLIHPLALAWKWSGFVRGWVLGGRQRRLVSLSAKVAGWTGSPAIDSEGR